MDRMLNTSMTKRLVDVVTCSVIQVHPPRYGGSKYSEFGNIFTLLSGDQRDAYLARWAKILDDFGRKSDVFAYNYVDIPLLIPLDGVNEHPSVLESSKNFETYVNDIASKVELRKMNPIILFGHNFTSSIVSATKSREPDAILIGHTYDEGFKNQLRTPLAYQIMNKVDCVVIVYHEGKMKAK